MRNIAIRISVFWIAFLLISFVDLPDDQRSTATSVAELLFEAGKEKPGHYLEYTEADVKRGEELVFKGKTEHPPKGKRSKLISPYYQCTSCHNTVREDPDLTLVDPEARLNYAINNQIPYIQGSTFWGIVNRESWYNGDYEKKYGSLVDHARDSLRGSIQLCATVCAQGRELEPWEANSILAYFWTLEMKLADLDLSDAEKQDLDKWKNEGKDEQVRQLLESKYLSYSPATFTKLPDNLKEGYPLEGRPEKGKAVYELGCQHCHHPYGESDRLLDNSHQTFRWLEKHIDEYTDLGLYHITRYGTYAQPGHNPYMPLYTEEKLSDQQVEDLRAYIEQQAAKGPGFFDFRN